MLKSNVTPRYFRQPTLCISYLSMVLLGICALTALFSRLQHRVSALSRCSCPLFYMHEPSSLSSSASACLSLLFRWWYARTLFAKLSMLSSPSSWLEVIPTLYISTINKRAKYVYVCVCVCLFFCPQIVLIRFWLGFGYIWIKSMMKVTWETNNLNAYQNSRWPPFFMKNIQANRERIPLFPQCTTEWVYFLCLMSQFFTTLPAVRWLSPTSRKNGWINGRQVQQEGGCMITWLNQILKTQSTSWGEKINLIYFN